MHKYLAESPSQSHLPRVCVCFSHWTRRCLVPSLWARCLMWTERLQEFTNEYFKGILQTAGAQNGFSVHPTSHPATRPTLVSHKSRSEYRLTACVGVLDTERDEGTEVWRRKKELKKKKRSVRHKNTWVGEKMSWPDFLKQELVSRWWSQVCVGPCQKPKYPRCYHRKITVCLFTSKTTPPCWENETPEIIFTMCNHHKPAWLRPSLDGKTL